MKSDPSYTRQRTGATGGEGWHSESYVRLSRYVFHTVVSSASRSALGPVSCPHVESSLPRHRSDPDVEPGGMQDGPPCIRRKLSGSRLAAPAPPVPSALGPLPSDQARSLPALRDAVRVFLVSNAALAQSRRLKASPSPRSRKLWIAWVRPRSRWLPGTKSSPSLAPFCACPEVCSPGTYRTMARGITRGSSGPRRLFAAG